MKKQIISLVSSTFLTLVLVSPVFAQDASVSPKQRPLGQLKERVVQSVKNLRPRAVINSGKVTAVNSSTLTVEKDGKTYTVLTGTFDKCTTNFHRRFGGESSLSEIQSGNEVNIIGVWQDEGKTTIEACAVRNVSVQKFRATFVGTVESLTDSGFVFKSMNRGTQTVTISSSTKLIDRREEIISKSDIAVGHRVRISGVWDRSDNTISEVTKVKDFSLPIVPTKTPGTSISPTPNST